MFIENMYNLQISISVFKSKLLKCLSSGWSDKGTRSFWKFYFYPELPTLQDAFEDNGTLTFILSCMLLNTHPEYYFRIENIFSKDWALYFHQGNSRVYRDYPINRFEPIIGRVVSNTDEKKILVIQFKIPEKYQNRFNFATIQMIQTGKSQKVEYRPFNSKEVTNQRTFREGETELQGYQNYTKLFMNRINSNDIDKYGISYRNVPFCPIKDKFSKYTISNKPKEKEFLRICTENLIFEDKQRNVDLLRWALYHKYQGFGIPIVYYNKIIPKNNQHPKDYDSYIRVRDRTMKILGKALDNGAFELVQWEFPYAFYFHDQLGQEASCIYRNKGRTKWLGINDVDEFFYNPNQRTKDTINITMSKIIYSDFVDKFGGIIAPNVWMKFDKKKNKVYQDDYMSEYERTKCIIIPDNVYAFHVHTVNNGLQTVSFNKNNVVNAHFKVIPDDSYNNLFYSEKMTKYYDNYTAMAREYLGLPKDENPNE